MATKADLKEVASIINQTLRTYDEGEYKPRISVVETENMGFGFGKYSLVLNNEAYALAQEKGRVQDLMYADEVYVVGDNDFYIEPVSGRYFDISVL